MTRTQEPDAKPQPGDFVLYCTENGSIRPAFVVVVESFTTGRVSLSILTDGQRDSRWSFAHPKWEPNIDYGQPPRPGTWHWPARKRTSMRSKPKSDTVIEVVFWGIVAIVGLGICAALSAYSCHAKWEGSGMPVQWHPVAGCQIQLPDKTWIPEAHYRQTN